MVYENLRVNGERLKETLEKMAEIGATPGGGVQRLALSKEDKRARDLFVKWLEQIDLEIQIDEMGNIFGKRPGRKRNLPPVMTGSHIDSQPKGGRFDGIFGMMGALEVLRTLHEHQVTTQRPMTIVNWTNEEGARFTPAMLGSGVWIGKFGKDWAYERRDIDGKKLGEELKRIGYKGKLPAKKSPVYAYYELHVEQGPILEREGKVIASPKGIICRHHHDVYVMGTANQVGPTPMEGRNDALCAAAEMILKINELPEKMGGEMVATVGRILNFPNSRNVIPDKVYFHVDIRSWDENLSAQAWRDVQRDFKAIAQRRGCRIQMRESERSERTLFHKRLVKRVAENAERLGYSYHDGMVGGAGHDACHLSQVAPTAMIFVPSIGGRSHAEVENTRWEDCEAGANVLLHCILQLASEK